MTLEEQKLVSKVFFPFSTASINISDYDHQNVRDFFRKKGTDYKNFALLVYRISK